MVKSLLKQREAYKYLANDYTKYIVYGGAAGGGKSWLGCEWLLQCCHNIAGSRWFIGRNNIKDTIQSVLITFDKVAKAHKYTAFKTNGNGIQFKNGSEIVFLDLTFYPFKDPLFERLGSKEYTGGWIEEGGEIHGLAFEVLKSRVGRHLNKEFNLCPKLLITCNPKKNWLYEDFYKPFAIKELSNDKMFIAALPTDNENLTADYLESLASIKDTATKERLLHGNWEYDDDPSALIEYDAILDLFNNSHVENEGNTYISSDIAMQGSDKMVTLVWRGLTIIDMNISAKNDGQEALKIITDLKNKYNVPNSRIVYDSDGVGSFVGGFLKGAKSFVNNATPLKIALTEVEQFKNIKTQCYFKLAEYINSRSINIACNVALKDKERIIKELEQVKSYKSDTSEKLMLQPKAITKTNIGSSPDFTDAMAMYMSFLIKPTAKSFSISF